ncbi:MAG: S-ribosylhomocysteine lyase [Synergistaceae bacterium]|jgi:S-ribosylhomocysteine lyase|nr:S-ribosylhomocysteine lyase [Synergistaceae bacterium]
MGETMGETMERIASFSIDHDVLQKGMYVSRIDGDIVTYDIRMVRPNAGYYIDTAALHTFEHLFATYVRNSRHSKSVVYVGPMGCRTGFYFLVRDDLGNQQALDLFRETLAFIEAFEGPIPGASKSAECGNYLEHDLGSARKVAADMTRVLKDWTVADMAYNAH